MFDPLIPIRLGGERISRHLNPIGRSIARANLQKTWAIAIRNEPRPAYGVYRGWNRHYCLNAAAGHCREQGLHLGAAKGTSALGNSTAAALPDGSWASVDETSRR